MAIRILHTADLHLGAISKGLGAYAKDRMYEIIETFYRMLDFCKNDQVDLLLIAGDFIESVISPGLLNDIKKKLADLDIDVFISPGNHDYYVEGGIYDGDWGDKIHIFKGEVEEYLLKDFNLRIYGAAFRSSYQEESLLKNFKPDQDQEKSAYKNILLMHGDYENRASVYNPIMLKDIEEGFFDYLALGHIHKRPEPVKFGRSILAYPGCPDACGFDETGPKGAYLITLEEDRLNQEFVTFSSRIFHRLEVDLTEISNIEEALEACLQIAKKNSPDPKKDFYRFRLLGRRDREDSLDIGQLKRRLKEELYYVEINDLRSPFLSIDSMAEEESIRGYFINLIKEEMLSANESEKVLLTRAMNYGLLAMEGRELDLED